jgi:hypothetical protein
MVMGASSHGRWHRMLVGSTLSTVLESLPCDIIVIVPPEHSYSEQFLDGHACSTDRDSDCR